MSSSTASFVLFELGPALYVHVHIDHVYAIGPQLAPKVAMHRSGCSLLSIVLWLSLFVGACPSRIPVHRCYDYEVQEVETSTKT
jgi:hypothetical protein